MKPHEMTRFMKENGFSLLKRGSKGTKIWGDGISTVATALTPSDYRADRNVMAEVKRAVRRRTSMAGESDLMKVNNHRPIEREPRKSVIAPKALTATLGELGLRVIEKKEEEKKMEAAGKSMYPFNCTYDPKTKEKIQLRIIELFEQSKSWAYVTKKLNDEGYRNASGSGFTYGNVYDKGKKLGLVKPKEPEKTARIKAPVAPQAKPAPARVQHLSNTARAILTDPSISAEKRIKIVLMYDEG